MNNDEMDEGETESKIGIAFLVLFCLVFILAIGLGGYCTIHYWGTPWLDVPFMCHFGR